MLEENSTPTRTVANFLGVGVDAITYPQVDRQIDQWLRSKDTRSHHIACLNAYCVTLALKDARLRQIYNGADIAGADGVPFVWWARHVYKAPCDRLDGPDLLLHLARRSETLGYTFYFYGATEDVVQNMIKFLKARFPKMKIVGSMAPPFRALTVEEDSKLISEINRLRPDILCVGLGTPKQDYWIDEHLYKIRGTVMIACGATFDFFGGRIKMAPPAIRRSGFEWLYRLFSKDFKRLWKRYTIMNALFMWYFALQIINIIPRPLHRWERG